MQDRTEDEIAADRAVLLAVLSPMLAGCAWAALTYVAWSIEYPGTSEDDLSAVISFWGLLFLGIVGLLGLSVPLAIGLTAKSEGTRIAAAFAGAAITALAGVFWLLAAAESVLTGSAAILPYAGAATLFMPIAALVVATRRRST